MRTAVAYIRVSRADKKRGLTLDIQLDAITAYAAREGYELLEVSYVDEGKSAYTNRIDKRPAFQQMLRDAQSKGRPWSLVLVYKTDRFARDALLQLQCRRDLLKLGVRTESATQHNPDDSAIGKLNIVLDAGLNEYYSALLSDRMRDVRRFEASQGRHVGPIPVGYDRQQGVLHPNDRAAAALLAGQLYATGQESAARITAALNTAGYTNAEGEPFKVYAIEEMLKNPVYAGFVVCNGQCYQGAHQPIWDAALWQRMQEVRAQRSRRRTRPVMRHDPLLAGFIYCGHCGAPMWHFPRDGFRAYRCSVVPSRRPGPIADLVCGDTWAHAEAVEAATLAWVGALALLPEVLARAQARLATAPKPASANHEVELRKLKHAFLAEQISAATYEARKAELTATFPAVVPAIDDTAVLQLLTNLPVLLERATARERRAVLGQLITAVYAQRKAVLAFRPTRLAQQLFLAAAETAAWRDVVLTNRGDGGPGGHQACYATISKNLAHPIILEVRA